MFDSLEPSGSRTAADNGTSGTFLRIFVTHSDLRHSLRRAMRQKRLALTPPQQQQAATALIAPAMALIQHYQAQRIACYLPFNGEISPLPLMETLHQQGKSLYLPRLHPFADGQLLFLAYTPHQPLSFNRFGIAEPRLDVRNVLPLAELDLIFVPLVACDKQGNRLGMGGGFYDRTLAQAPQLVSVGLAHCCQQVEALPLESWDQPLKHLIVV